MPSKLSSELLARATASVLEQAAFIFAEIADTPIPFKEEVLEAHLSMSGPCQGYLMIASSKSFAVSLAANMLGIETDDVDAVEKSADALGELLNILSGQIIEEILGNKAVCQLGVPKVKIVSPDIHEQQMQDAPCTISLMTEDGYRVDIIGTIEI